VRRQHGGPGQQRGRHTGPGAHRPGFGVAVRAGQRAAAQQRHDGQRAQGDRGETAAPQAVQQQHVAPTSSTAVAVRADRYADGGPTRRPALGRAGDRVDHVVEQQRRGLALARVE